MKILVVNDDGIEAVGIKKLANTAKQFGKVFVVAPEGQCSAMSHKITLTENLKVKFIENYDVQGVHAYSVSGTPADCVKAAVECILDERPDIVFSGINKGYNAGAEIVYSGTVAAAMEGLLKGIPAIAFSVDCNDIYDVVDEYLSQVIKDVLSKDISKSEIWNINFPGCSKNELKGIEYGVIPAKTQYYVDDYHFYNENKSEIQPVGVRIKKAEEGSDLCALINNYIAIGKVRSMVL